jgi:hypothetical protein
MEELSFCVEDWEHTPHIHAEELVRRLRCHFPEMIVDREKGNDHVQEGLERLKARQAPNVILESHRSYFGNVIYVSISEGRWNGATANSHLYSIWPPLGDWVHFDVIGAPDAATIEMITQELASAMGLILCSEIPESEKGTD